MTPIVVFLMSFLVTPVRSYNSCLILSLIVSQSIVPSSEHPSAFFIENDPGPKGDEEEEKLIGKRDQIPILLAGQKGGGYHRQPFRKAFREAGTVEEHES